MICEHVRLGLVGTPEELDKVTEALGDNFEVVARIYNEFLEKEELILNHHPLTDNVFNFSDISALAEFFNSRAISRHPMKEWP